MGKFVSLGIFEVPIDGCWRITNCRDHTRLQARSTCVSILHYSYSHPLTTCILWTIDQVWPIRRLLDLKNFHLLLARCSVDKLRHVDSICFWAIILARQSIFDLYGRVFAAFPFIHALRLIRCIDWWHKVEKVWTFLLELSLVNHEFTSIGRGHKSVRVIVTVGALGFASLDYLLDLVSLLVASFILIHCSLESFLCLDCSSLFNTVLKLKSWYVYLNFFTLLACHWLRSSKFCDEVFHFWTSEHLVLNILIQHKLLGSIQWLVCFIDSDVDLWLLKTNL